MEVVHVGYRDSASSNNVVVAYEDGGHGTQEDSVATEESQKGLCRGKDFPRYKRPAANESSEELAAANVDVSWTEGHQVVGGADGVGGYVDTKRDDDQADGGKRRRSTPA